ncbi:MAG: UvrD-helicase domain-containing protein [Deltaproteobacteria bacterium]|nr:UvrD-helicase domain-containing protein [Deltaproteobacteria bacterium]
MNERIVPRDDVVRELTAEQRAAVETPGSVVVRAGAGSGKTAVLVARYVRLVCGADGAPAPLDVAQVLAVTFTEKAAAEMRGRIRAAIAARLAAATGAERVGLLRTQRALASARIGTIHALAASLLRRAPLESGTRPGATVLDEIDGPAYVEREVRRILLARLRAGDHDVRRCAEAWGFGLTDSAGLVPVTCDVLAELARRGLSATELGPALVRQEAAASAAATDLRRDTARVRALVAGWLGVAGEPGARVSAAASAAGAELRQRWPHWRAHLDALGTAGDVEDLLALRDFPSTAGRAFRQRSEWRACADLLTFKLQDGTPRFGGAIAAAFGCCCGLPLAAALTRVVHTVDAALALAKRRDGVLTFDDLIAGARRLFAEHAGVAARIMDDVRAILVDEFQDTDPAQVDLVRRLAAGGAELFVVGDEKQSIYRFRGAEVQLFAAMRTTLGCERSLADNFRSRPPLLAFVNGLAARLFAARADGAPWRVRWSPAQRLRPRRALDGAGSDGVVAIGGGGAAGATTFVDAVSASSRPLVRLKSLVNQIGASGTDLLAAPARALEARVIAATITELLGEGWRPRDVAVLLPALTQVKAYEYALRRWAIPYEVVRGRGFYECQEIRDLVHLLAAVVDPHDAVALAGALRSPLFGLSDEVLAHLADVPGGLSGCFTAGGSVTDLATVEAEEVGAARDLLLELRAVHDRVPAADVLTRAVAATHLEGVLLAQFHGAQKVANVRKLIAQARAVEHGRFVGAAEFVARARRLLENESREPEAPRLTSDAEAVQVMTVHQAKGLEFPVVILADLGREPPRDYRSPVLVDREYGVLAAATFGAGRHRLPHRLVDAWRRDDHDRADAERARLLYVACTRARDVLVLCEGKGRRSALADEGVEGDRTWCEQIWSFLGRETVAAFVAGAAERMIVEAPGEGPGGEAIAVAVEMEKSAALLARVSPPVRDTVETSIARALTETAAPADVRAVARVCDTPPPAPGALVVSPTALADYARCPRQFWYRHVRGVAETRESGRADRRAAGALETAPAGGTPPADAVRFGLAAHAALEGLDLELPAAARAAAVAAALAGACDLDDAERAAVGRDLVAALARFATKEGALRVDGREVPFCLRFAGPPEIFVRGRIDVLGERGARLVIRDYKYAPPARDGEAYRVQLEIYALAVAAAHPGRPLEVEIEWLRAPGGRVALPVDLATARAHAQATSTALAAALDTRAAPAFPLAFAAPAPCRAIGCGFVGRCFPRDATGDGGASRSAFRAPRSSATMPS